MTTSEPELPPRRPLPTIRLCFVGDSITVGRGDAGGQGWVARVVADLGEHGLDVTAYNLGVRGDTTNEIRQRWFREAARRLPFTDRGGLVFELGRNDCVRISGRPRRVPPQRTARNAAVILEQARAWLPTLVIGPVPVAEDLVVRDVNTGAVATVRNADVREASVALGQVSAALGLPFVDSFEPLHGDRTWRLALAKGDGIHPTADGYRAMARVITASEGWHQFSAQLRGEPRP